MVDNKVGNYEQFVIVAETEWKFDYGDFEKSEPKMSCGCRTAKCASCNRSIYAISDARITKQSLKMGTIEWNIAFNDKSKKVNFYCQNLLADGAVSEAHMELVPYYRSESNESYVKSHTIRLIFTRSANALTYSSQRDNLFTVRVLKQRSMFPDFTSESTAVVAGRWASDVKLRVVDQLFHVNKQLLAMHSEYFDRMFNGPYVEANKEEVELKHEQADAAMFHDFLLVMFVPEVLPNPSNVAALTKLANIYDADAVRNKCHIHLTICREMPVEERFMLAGEIGNKELQSTIRQMASFEERDRIIAVVSEKAFALTNK